MTRLLHLPPDPAVTAALATYELDEDPRSYPDEWRAALERLASLGFAPAEWSEPETCPVHPWALPVAIRNPRAIVSAERVLRDTITAEMRRARDESTRAWLADAYGGVIRYEDARGRVLDVHDGFASTRNAPNGLKPWGYKRAWDYGDQRVPRSWGGVREELYAWPIAHAYAALLGAEWQRAIYAMGLGVALLREVGVPEATRRERWYLIVRDGDGWEWPTLEPDPDARATT